MTHRYTLPLATDADVDLVAADLMGAGAVGLWQRERAGRTELVAWFAAPTDAVPPGGRWDVEPQRDWLATWRAGLEPITVGRVRVVPSWRVDDLADPATSGRGAPVTVVIDPAMAFGTGHHATTRLCLRRLQEADPRERSVLDVGTGSGILAIAAAKLGAARVVAVDTDPDAVAAARANVDANSATVEIRRGSLERAADGPFDLVVANLTTDVVVALADRLLTTTRRRLIVSGVSTDRAVEATAALRAAAVTAVAATEHTTEAGWLAIDVLLDRDR